MKVTRYCHRQSCAQATGCVDARTQVRSSSSRVQSMPQSRAVVGRRSNTAMNRRAFLSLAIGVLAVPVATTRWSIASAGIALDEFGLVLAAIDLLSREFSDSLSPIVVGPISLLQRHLRLGYGRACRLASELERIRIWSPCRDGIRLLLVKQS